MMKLMENKKQTAVEWLVSKIWKTEPLEHEKEVIEQAEAIEKEHLIESRVTAPIMFATDKESYIREAEQYYNETYGK